MLIVVILFGLVVGSFLNALVWRMHEEKSIVRGRSMCPHCHHVLGVADLVPVLSWVFLRGKCRYCRKPISPGYPLGELVVGAAFGLSYAVMQPEGVMAMVFFWLWLVILSALLAAAFYDLQWYLLPDAFMIPAIVVAFAVLVLRLHLGAAVTVVTGPVLAALLFGGIFFLMVELSEGKWMGGGDIRLVFLMGLILGLQKTALAMLLAFNIAAVVGIGLILLRRRKRSDQIPFGPFLVLATVIALLYGGVMIDWYARTSGLYML